MPGDVEGNRRLAVTVGVGMDLVQVSEICTLEILLHQQ